MMEHYRPDGLYSGYFCMKCGEKCNMLATGHENCKPNPELVKILIELNKK